MNIWKEALNEFNKRCDEQESCVFCALCSYSCIDFRRTLEELSYNEDLVEVANYDKKQ